MKITFNALGIITSTITNDEPLRQGNVGNTLKAIFEDKINSDYSATLTFTRSDGEIMSNVYMNRDTDEHTYKYVFADSWFFAKAGTTTLTIYLKQNGTTIASGQVQFDIEESDIEEDTTITPTQYQALLQSLADLDIAKIDKVNGIICKEIENEDAEDYDVGTHIYDTKTKQMYVVVEGLANNKFQLDDAFIDMGSSTSGTLTDSQFEIVKNKNAIIHIVDAGIDYFLRRIMYVSGPNFYRFECFTLISPTTDEIRFKTIHIDVEDRTHTYSGNIEITTQYKNSKVDALLDGKLNKVSTSGTNRLYGVDLSGNQTMHQVATANYPDSVAKRDSNGNIDVAYTPTADYHATSRRYVLEQIANAIAGVYKPQGTKSVAEINALTITSAYNGYVYNVSDAGELVNEDETTLEVNAGDNVVLIWNNGDYYWDAMSSFIDLTPYLTISAFNTAMENYDTKAEVNTKIATAKQELANKYDIYDFNISTSYPNGEIAITTEQAEDLLAKKPQFIRVNTGGSPWLYVFSPSASNWENGSAHYSRIDEISPSSGSNNVFIFQDGELLFSGLTGESPTIYIETRTRTATPYVDSNCIPVRINNGNIAVPQNPSSDSDATSKYYVDGQIQNVREVANGQTKAFILSVEDTITYIKEHTSTSVGGGKVYLATDPTKTFSNQTFTDITAEVQNGDYDSITIKNSMFNTNSEYIDVKYGMSYPMEWYLCVRKDNSNFYLLRYVYTQNFRYFKNGDVVYVIQTNVPDRWSNGDTRFYALEGKSDLSNYYTKIQSDARYVKQETLGDAYDNTRLYAVGDLVIYNNKLYKCITAITQPEDFDSTKWMEVSITEAFGILSKANTWSEVNTFLDNPIVIKKSNVGGNAVWSIEEDQYSRLAISHTYNNTKVYYWRFDGNAMLPNTDNGCDIGTTNRRVNKFFVSKLMSSGNNNYGITLPDTTDWTANKQLATTDETIKTISYTDFQALQIADKLALLDSGCRIIGTLSVNVGDGDVINPYLYPRRNYTSYSQGIFIAGSSDQNPTVGTYELVHSGTNLTIKVLFRGNDQNTIFAGLVRPNVNNTQDVGTNTQRWKNIFIGSNLDMKTGSKIITHDKNSSYGLVSPDTSNWVSDKEIATIEEIIKLDTGTYTSGTPMSANDLAFFQPLLDMNLEEATRYLSHKIYMRLDVSRNETQTSTNFSVRASGQGFDRSWYDITIPFGNFGSIVIIKTNLQDGKY